MKPLRIIILSMLILLVGCATSSGPASTSTDAVGQSRASDRVEGFFIQPAVNFTRYHQIILTDINLRDIDIRQSAAAGKTPWVLSDEDRRYYREQYIAAVVGHFVADGRYTTALDTGENVLRMDATVIEIAPVVVPENTDQSAAMKSYVEGMATMTLKIEVRDSLSNELLASFIDTRNLGRIWNENNRMNRNREIRIAFEEWLGALRFYMDELTLR